MMDEETIADIRQILVTQRCESMDNHGSFIHFVFSRGGLTVGCLWRLTHLSSLVASSATADEGPDLLADLLNGRSVESVEVHGIFNDLRLTFDEGFVFEAFADSEIHENWVLNSQVRESKGREFIGTGPGNRWFRV